VRKKGRRGKKKREKEKGKRKIKGKKEKDKGIGKIGKFLGKTREKGEKILVEFSGFSGAGVISGTTLMARRAGRWDRGKPGIPGKVADSSAGAAHGERRWPD
jgi:hypothetical protein